MPPKKTRYSSSLSTAWVVPPVSRPSSANESNCTQSDTPEAPRDHETTRSSTSTSRSKYTTTIPSSWIIPSLLKGPSNENESAAIKSSNGKKGVPQRAPLGVTDREAVASPQVPPGIVDRLFPPHREHHESEPKAALRDHRIEQRDNNRGAAADRTQPPPPAVSSPGGQTAVSSTSASGSCDIPAAAPRVSPSYSVV